MIGLLISAGIPGGIIMVMEGGEFPGIFAMIGCVLAAALVNELLPDSLFIVGLAVGALAAGLAISALCGMSVKRSCIAAAIYLAVRGATALGLSAAFA